MTPPVETEVLVVGAGAAGAVIAATLAAAGRRVHVVEAGPGWDPSVMVSSQIWSRRLRGGPVATGGAHPVGAGFNLGRGLGGAAAHHYATWPRLREEDFRLRSTHGEGLDWPFDYATLRPFYDRVQREVGIAGDAAAEVWRAPGDPYPMPPHPVNAQARTVAAGFAKLGLRVAPAPMAINSVEYGGRPPCLYDGWCDAGCPIGALANPHVTYLPKAEAAGATFEADAPALRLAAGRGGRVTGVAVGGKHARTIRARAVVLAASVPGNPALLLASGLGGPATGRYLMTHAAVQTFGLFDRVETRPHEGLTGAMLIGHDGYKRGAAPFTGAYQWLIAPAMKPNDLAGLATSRPDIIGAALAPFMARAARHMGNMIGMADALPDAENRVTLAGGERAGEPPRPALTHRHRPGALAAWARMAAEGLAVMRAGGAAEAWHGRMFSAHLMGGTVMGTDPAVSVTDGFGRVHGHPNVFIGGPGLFPTGGPVNPTFTVHALALRTAEHLAATWATVAG